MKLKPISKRLVALTLSLTVAVAFTELVLRWAQEAPAYTDTSVDSRFTGYRLTENWAEPREFPEIIRILVLGDSFTWGAGVHEEDAYPFRMQFRMNLQDPKRRYRVLNAGRNGLNTVAERELLDSLGLLDSEPDLVLLGFTLNDSEPSDSKIARQYRRAAQRRTPQGRIEMELHRRSQLFRLTYDRIENLRQRRAFNQYMAILFDTESAHWQECVRALASLRDYLGDRGIPLLVAVLPAFDGRFGEDYLYREQHEQIMGALASMRVPAIDLHSAYDGLDTRRLAVVPLIDAHPNELAHRIAADFLSAYVRDCLAVAVEEAGNRQRSWQCGQTGGVR